MWQVPVCVRYGAGAKVGRACTLLTERTGVLALPEGAPCPEWLLPNEGGVGYYLSRLEGNGLAGDGLDGLLVRAKTTIGVPERIALVGDVNALVANGSIEKARALALVPTLAADESRHVVEASMSIVRGVDEILPPSRRPAYEAFLRQTYGARARTLGWQSRPGESDDIKELRPALLARVAGDGRDANLSKGATLPEVEATFGPRLAKLEGGPRLMQQLVEQVSLCATARKAQAPSCWRFFSELPESRAFTEHRN
jgi:alanyl aminopeptidase